MLFQHENINNHNDYDEELLSSNNDNDNHCVDYHLLNDDNNTNVPDIIINDDKTGVTEGSICRKMVTCSRDSPHV